MENKISILHITPFFAPNVGGVETHLNDLVEILSGKNSLKVKVITYQALVGDKKGKRKEKFGNIEINRIPWISGFYYESLNSPVSHFLYLTPRLFWEALKFNIKNKDIDVVHAHGINAAFIGSFLKRIFNKKFFVSFHVDFNFKRGTLLTRAFMSILNNADKIFVLTKKSKNKLVKLGLNPIKILVYSYWVNQRIFKPLSKRNCRKRLGIGQNKFCALFVGRLAGEKGVLQLLEVAEKLKDVDFYFIGSGDLENALLKAAQRNSNIKFIGSIENKKLPPFYNATDILIVPSQVSSPRPVFEEGVPRVIIEAISCGTPVVGTDSGGIKDVVESGEVGIVSDYDSESLRNAIGRLQNNPRLLEKMQRNCRKYAVSRFSQDSSKIITDAYENLELDQCLFSLLKNTGDMALKRRARWIIDSLDLENGDKILDVGCGDGFYLHLLSNLGLKLDLTGTDFDKRALESAERNLKGKKIKLIRADLMKKLPFKDNYFDKIVMSEVVEHLPNDVKGFMEAKRVLKPKGTLALSVPNANYPLLWDPINWTLEHLFDTHIKSGFFAGIWNQHERLYEMKHLKNVIKKVGFTVCEQRYATWWCLPFNHYLINLGARILAKGKTPALAEGASKFNTGEKKSMITKIYFLIAEIVDKLNDLIPLHFGGVSIVVSTQK